MSRYKYIYINSMGEVGYSHDDLQDWLIAEIKNLSPNCKIGLHQSVVGMNVLVVEKMDKGVYSFNINHLILNKLLDKGWEPFASGLMPNIHPGIEPFAIHLRKMFTDNSASG